jgi:hypothetical protein
MFVIGGCVWSDVPKDAVYSCADGKSCPDGRVCRNNYCFAVAPVQGEDASVDVPDACVPITCQSLGASCGPIPNGCGEVLDCGNCMGYETCGGGPDGGVANHCGCTPLTSGAACQIAGKTCGTITRFNGCGEMSDFTCGVACAADGGCQAETNAELCTRSKYICGMLGVKDRCGVARLIQCGVCIAPNSCFIDEEITDGGFASNCGACAPEDDWTFCNRHGASCGQLLAPLKDNCGMNRSPNCGECLTEDGGDGCGVGSVANVCGCQMPLSGCTANDQCCAGAKCGSNGMCCVAAGNKCGDDADCCQGHCTAQGTDGGAVCVVSATSGP